MCFLFCIFLFCRRSLASGLKDFSMNSMLQVLQYLGVLVEKVAGQVATAQRVNKYQRLFKLEETKWACFSSAFVSLDCFGSCGHVGYLQLCVCSS